MEKADPSVLPITDLRLQGRLHRLLAHRVLQHGMDGKQFQQLADMGSSRLA